MSINVLRGVRATSLTVLSLVLLLLVMLYLTVAHGVRIVRAVWHDFYSQEAKDAQR